MQHWMYFHLHAAHIWTALGLLAPTLTTSLRDRRSSTSAIPAHRHLLTPLIAFTAAVPMMGASAQPQQHHSRSFFISRFSSNTTPRSRYFPGQPWHHRLHTAAHQLPSRSHLSCLAVGETRSFLLVPRCQEGADGRCALPIILFLWYPACWQNSRSNIWRQEFAVYFQFWVTAKRHHGVQGEEERLILVLIDFCSKRNQKEKLILKKKKGVST